MLEFLTMFTPCMCVMSTSGPNYKVSDMSKSIEELPKTGLHMLCCLVPIYMLRNDLSVESAQRKIHPFARKLIPVETTGFNYNSYVTPNALLSDVDDAKPGKGMLLNSVQMYNELVHLSMGNLDVKQENINVALIINDERVTKFGSNLGSGKRGDSFVRPHYFYGRFITLCHSLTGAMFKPKFLDMFRKTTGGKYEIGVEFADAVMTLDDAHFEQFDVRTPVNVTDKTLFDNIDKVCQIYANNVQPVPIEINQPPRVLKLDGNEIQMAMERVYHDYGDTVVSDFVNSIMVKRISFYVNKISYSNSESMMRQLKSYFENQETRRKVSFNYNVDDVEHQYILNGAVEFYALHLTF
jgi:hypothetical protein